MYHDPELPGGFQDAEFEMAALTAAGDRAAALADQGICTHGWLFAPPFGEAKCNECGKAFGDAAHARAEGYNRLHGFDDDDSAGWHYAGSS
jgi:hypothetical protein